MIFRDSFGEETFYDYDKCEYVLNRVDTNPDVLKFGFSCMCYKQIIENGGQDMLNELYKDCLLPEDEQLQQCDITLKIDASNMLKTEKVKKTMTEEESEAIRTKNDDIR